MQLAMLLLVLQVGRPFAKCGERVSRCFQRSALQRRQIIAPLLPRGTHIVRPRALEENRSVIRNHTRFNVLERILGVDLKGGVTLRFARDAEPPPGFAARTRLLDAALEPAIVRFEAKGLNHVCSGCCWVSPTREARRKHKKDLTRSVAGPFVQRNLSARATRVCRSLSIASVPLARYDHSRCIFRSRMKLTVHPHRERAMRYSALTVSAALVVMGASLPAAAQEKRSDTLLTVEHYLDLEQVADPQVSPDGKQIVYTRRYVNKLDDRWDSALWIMNADGSHNRMLSKGGSAAWSPDGSRLAYLADGEPRGAQIFVRYMDAEGATSQITRTMESPADVRWSPDGKSLGFSMFVPAPRNWRIDMPEAPKGAHWTPAPRYETSLHFKQDRRGFMESGNRHLFVVSAEGGTPRQITNGNWSVGSRFDAMDGAVGWDWAPDGRTIVFDAFADSTGDMNYRSSNIHAVDVNTGAMRRLTPQNGAWSSPVVSPDGRKIAYRGYTQVNDSYHASELYVMNADGSGANKLSADLDRDVGDVSWVPDGSGIYFTVQDHGLSNLSFVGLTGGVKPVTSGEHMLTSFALAPRAGAALVGVGIRSSYKQPADIVRIALRGSGVKAGDLTQLTRVNEDLLARIKLGDVEHVTYTSTSGTKVDGWIVKPPNFDPAKKYPLIMEIHGGPHGMYNVAFNYQFQNFAANNFVVLYTNPRGSTGYGSAFGNAIMHAYPSVDYDDLMAGVDTVVARGYVDTRAMYVGGCSGGGVLSSWVIGHTNRFAAAAVRCPVINWMSFAGQSDVPLFTYNFFDKPFWEAPEQWLKQSPLMYVGNVTTPTVVMTGELDRRTPMPQSEEYYAALKMRGVPTALLRFEGEFHGTGSKPSNFMRTQLYMMSWYNKWKRAPSGGVITAEQ